MSITNFQKTVYNMVRDIKRGQTMTYAEVARAAGEPKAYRAVGNALTKNYNSNVPCHRVIRSDGKIGGYNRGAKMKQKLLQEENITIADS